jgi:hypothetical protein
MTISVIPRLDGNVENHGTSGRGNSITRSPASAVPDLAV